MKTIFHVHPDELNLDFLAILKSITHGSALKIEVESLDLNDMDDTTYLLSSPVNKAFLIQAKEELAEGKVVEMSWEDHEKLKLELGKLVTNG